MSDSIHFRSRAELEYANAAAATLDNVRERSERAAKAWEAMADRADQTIATRERREAERAVAAAQHVS